MKRFLLITVGSLRGTVATMTMKTELVVRIVFSAAISLIFSPFHIPLILGYFQTARTLADRLISFIRPFS